MLLLSIFSIPSIFSVLFPIKFNKNKKKSKILVTEIDNGKDDSNEDKTYAIQNCRNPSRCSHHHFVNLAYTKYKIKSKIVRVYDAPEIESLRAYHILYNKNSELEKNENRNGTDSVGEESDWGDVLVASIGIVKLYYE